MLKVFDLWNIDNPSFANGTGSGEKELEGRGQCDGHDGERADRTHEAEYEKDTCVDEEK